VGITSIASNRGRAFGVVIAMAMSVTLVASSLASAANDPVATGVFKLKLGGSFKNQLRINGVHMNPKSPKFKSGSLDPVTGAGTLRLAKITFRKDGQKLVYPNVKAVLGAFGAKGNIHGNNGKLFQLRGGTVTRNGFGATLTGVKVKLLKSAAKKINKKLGLHSLHQGKAGAVMFAEQPKTVQVTGGTAYVDIPSGYLPTSIGGPNTDPNTVAAKQPSHCIDPVLGVRPIGPAHKTSTLEVDPELGPPPTGVAARFRFPVTGGTVGPTGTAGVIQLAGGVRLQTGAAFVLTPPGITIFPQPSNCAEETQGTSTSHSYLDTTNLAPNLELGNVQANVFIGGTSPGCNFDTNTSNCAIFGGDKGIAIGQLINSSGATVSANSTDRTVAINGALITNNATSTLTLNGLFPNASADPTKDFANGDKFGISSIDVSTR
jgi:hypothetical protein